MIDLSLNTEQFEQNLFNCKSSFIKNHFNSSYSLINNADNDVNKNK